MGSEIVVEAVDVSAMIQALIERVSNGESGEDFEQVARRYNALPLAEGWFSWALLTEQGEVMEAPEGGPAVPAVEPLRTMFLVAGARRYPELVALLPARPSQSVDCTRCAGTGWMKHGGGKIRCHECRSLGWIELGRST
jgi:hypothetical protein